LHSAGRLGGPEMVGADKSVPVPERQAGLMRSRQVRCADRLCRRRCARFARFGDERRNPR
jgi:hypothetical protein